MVSVVVITFNSEKFILETLESIKSQTYKKIELIISDDCSQDKTISLCEDWSEKNKKNFQGIKILKNKENLGVGKNLNKGIKEASGEWIKPIAGDDVLLKNCIENNMKFIKGNNDVKILFSKAIRFNDELTKENIIDEVPYRKEIYKKKAETQFLELLIRGSFPITPTVFVNRDFLKKINYFEEKYIIEDYPTWLKITKKGYKLYYFDESTVFYRIHKKSLSNNIGKIFNEKMIATQEEIYTEYSKGVKIGFFEKKVMQISSFVIRDTIKRGNNRILFRNRILLFLINPMSLINLIKRYLLKI